MKMMAGRSGKKIIETFRSNYIGICDIPNVNILLYKLDGDGKLIWQKKTLSEYVPEINWGQDIIQISPTTFLILATFHFNSMPYYSGTVLIKIDEDGNILWRKRFERLYGTQIINNINGEYIIVGFTLTSYSPSFRSNDLFIMQVDSTGNVNWTKTYGGSNEDRAFSVCKSHVDGFLISGYSKSYSDEQGDLWILKTNSDGGLLWQQTYGGIGYDSGNFIKPTTDQGYLISGQYGGHPYDIYLLKIDEDGKTTSIVHENYFYESSPSIINFPNPFNNSTKIEFYLSVNTSVSLSIYDVAGKKIKTLISNELMNKGLHSRLFDGTDFSNGIYICHLKTEYSSENIKLTFIK